MCSNGCRTTDVGNNDAADSRSAAAASRTATAEASSVDAVADGAGVRVPGGT